MQQAFQAIKRLVADFKAQEAAYLSPRYQEQSIREDFINKFFAALGWDVTHERQKNPYEQEVHIENPVKMSGSGQRHADYAFYLSPNFRDAKFFVEAKKPSRNLANADDYYQAIRYGWNAKTPLAILTDFEELHILDCRFKPNINEALSRKVESFHYSDYATEDKFAHIYYLISREAVAAGAIEKRATELPKPRGKGGQKGASRGAYQAVDEAFLEELDEYRITLAKAFKKANENLEGEELTEAVQRTIDRLVFIRFLEDKGIEEKAIINLKGQKSAWKAFTNLCKRCEPKYNGLVFKPHRILDDITLDDSEDKAFAQICAELADPGSPYDFNQIPISILGSIYERFLGKVVHATDKRVKVEEKPEVRKAGGVYYTPEHIVRYIVNETVGKLIEGKTAAEIVPMAFADIACGSGSFLIEVYAQLLDYHVRYYLANRDKAKPDDVFERDGLLHLSLKKKKEILLNNIYGVDIDFQATEVTQLSLYLKLLEDATMNDAHQFGLFKETILPDLKQNIVCGNSLVGRDIVEGSLFSNVDEAKLKPMNIEDVFPRILKKGGFDAVVGNPPWVSLSGKFRNELFGDDILQYLITRHSGNTYMPNLYEYFIHQGMTSIKFGGKLGYILPDRFGYNSQFVRLREKILSETAIEIILYKAPFPGITADTMIMILRRDTQLANNIMQISEFGKEALKTPQKEFLNDSSHTFQYYENRATETIIDRLKSKAYLRPLCDVCDTTSGFGGRSERITEKRVNQSQIAILKGESIGRYEMRKLFWFEFKRQNITGRTTDKSKLGCKEKILLRKTGGRLVATLDNSGMFPEQSLYFLFNKKIDVDFRFLLGVLNSQVIDFYYRTKAITNKKSMAQLKKIDLDLFPVPTPDVNVVGEKTKHDNVVKLVEQMLQVKNSLIATRMDSEVSRLQLQCDTLDRKIDEEMYDLYGLTEEEIKIVENETTAKGKTT